MNIFELHTIYHFLLSVCMCLFICSISVTKCLVLVCVSVFVFVIVFVFAIVFVFVSVSVSVLVLLFVPCNRQAGYFSSKLLDETSLSLPLVHPPFLNRTWDRDNLVMPLSLAPSLCTYPEVNLM